MTKKLRGENKIMNSIYLSEEENRQMIKDLLSKSELNSDYAGYAEEDEDEFEDEEDEF